MKGRVLKKIKVIHKTLKSVTHDLDNFKFNTAISKMMEMSNSIMSSKLYLKLISPL